MINTIKLFSCDIANAGQLAEKLKETLVIVGPLKRPHNHPIFSRLCCADLRLESSWALVEIQSLQYLRRIQILRLFSILN